MAYARSQSRHRSLLLGVSLIGVLVRGAATYADSGSEPRLAIETLSTAPNRVSGGDVLIKVAVPRSVARWRAASI